MAQIDEKQKLIQIVSSIRSAEALLIQASRQTSDASKLIQINTEYTALDSYLSQVLHTLAILDDALFDIATKALKQQAAILQQEEESIKKIVDDIALAAQIAGYLAQAAAIAATL